MSPPASWNREYDVGQSRPRNELQIPLVLQRVVLDGHDLALYLDLAWNGLLVRLTHDTVAEGFTDIEEKFVTFLLRVLDVLLVSHQLRDRVDHVRTIVQHSQDLQGTDEQCQFNLLDANTGEQPWLRGRKWRFSPYIRSAGPDRLIRLSCWVTNVFSPRFVFAAALIPFWLLRSGS